jgi:hypothetical protein
MQCEHDGFCASQRRFLPELISIPSLATDSDEDHSYLLRQKSQAKAARFRV